jgi:hypothetical protein
MPLLPLEIMRRFEQQGHRLTRAAVGAQELQCGLTCWLARRVSWPCPSPAIATPPPRRGRAATGSISTSHLPIGR